MIMKDCVTAKERLDFSVLVGVYAGNECVGCGQTAEQIAHSDGWNEEDFENNSVTADCGFWYCHSDCRRDSR